jgi:CRISPR-associated protein Cas2
MVLISYDIADTKLRTKFSKYIKKFGYRLQFSVYEITHSGAMLSKIKLEIDNHFMKLFDECDSVIIIETSATCKISRYGNVKHDENNGAIIVY